MRGSRTATTEDVSPDTRSGSDQRQGRAPLSLDGKTVWITGGGRGLGKALALGMSAAGARVAVTARTDADLEEVTAQIVSTGSEALALPGSVADPHVVARSVSRIVDDFGSLDVLVNMAGINPFVGASEDLADELWTRVIGVNLTGTFYCCRVAGKTMLEQGGGSIINVSSVHGTTGVPRMAAYVASKGGVEALTRALAVEWANRGVRVNCLAPGYFETSLTEHYLAGPNGDGVRSRTPMGRVGAPGELVGAAVFLASDASSFVTGTTLSVDGGWTSQ